MSEAALQPSIRVTLRAPAGSHDLVVGRFAPAGDLLVPITGVDPDGAALLTRDGRVLDVRQALADQGVQDGDLLVVAPTGTRARRTRRRPDGPGRSARGGPAAGPPLGRRRRAALLLVGSAAVVGAGLLLVGSATAAGGPATWPLLALLLASGLGAVGAPRTRPGDVVRLLAPLAGALAVLGLLAGPEPGAGLLALCAAAVVAAVLAAAARATCGTGREADVPLLVWVVVAAALAVVAGATVLAGGVPTVPWAVLGAGVLVTVRMLPTQLVEFPDDMLLELDRLSVTAWTAHSGPARRRARRRVRVDDVLEVVARSQRLHSAAVVAAAAVGAVASIVLAVAWTAPDAVRAAGTALLVASLAVGQALVARTVRERLARAALRWSAAVCFAALAVRLLAGVGGTGRLVVGLTAAGAALVTLAVAVALGRGWRSVRWARVADAAEGLAVALSLPAGLVAAGLVEQVRQLVS